ncbi:MAG: hypothetical protein J5857_04375 [Treponema sp.]|nr:hypothetical protein [Treponema sp.]
MKDKNKLIKTAGIINVVITILYACVLFLMFSHISFKVLKENAAEDLSVLFLKPNAERVVYWIAVILVSSFLSLSLFRHGFNSDICKLITFVVAVTLCIFEIISFVSPLWGQISIYLKMRSRDLPFDLNLQWSFVTTIMLIVVILRVYISYASLVLLSPKTLAERVKGRIKKNDGK